MTQTSIGIDCLSQFQFFLHLKEGDLDNANYWYDRAGTKMPKMSLKKEWQALVTELLPQ